MIIILDFDGTVVTEVKMGTGRDIGATPILRRLVERGHKLILYTLRSDEDNALQEAKEWFRDRKIELYSNQFNPDQTIRRGCPKIKGDLIIDDLALGIPLIHSETEGSYVDWIGVEKLLIEKNIL